ncbi:AbiJ-NTD4 domain-containing protein [Paraburkholderia strydomiana]|uniref:AbiJ-NTD4 domain-containing protein n=1 Tax=Paraburkholderia strydomiana TaxID=1245417 RepID=UPI0038BE15CD
MNYYSDRELGPKARIHHEITPVVWAGIVGLVQALLDTGGFGAKFPERCLDGQVACGSNEAALAAVLAAEMPGLAWPLETSSSPDGTSWSREPYAPPTLLVLDFLEFVWANVGKPVKVEYHNYQRHHHLRFDIEEGQADFCDDVNRLFSRNGVAYELTAVGQIRRILPETLGDMIARSRFETGDQLLDGLLEER